MKPPRFAAVAFALVFALVMPAMASAAVDQAEWDAAVAALEQVDPTISPPANDPRTVNAVGGGRLPATGNGFSFPTFGFGATIGQGGVNGQMTMNDGFGQTFSATVVCLAAASVPTGGAVARLVGELRPGSTTTLPTMLFSLTDSGLAGGEGDAWSVSFSPIPAAMFPCIPEGSAQPIEGSIVINVP
jgi:hypothetical protein